MESEVSLLEEVMTKEEILMFRLAGMTPRCLNCCHWISIDVYPERDEMFRDKLGGACLHLSCPCDARDGVCNYFKLDTETPLEFYDIIEHLRGKITQFGGDTK